MTKTRTRDLYLDLVKPSPHHNIATSKPLREAFASGINALINQTLKINHAILKVRSEITLLHSKQATSLASKRYEQALQKHLTKLTRLNGHLLEMQRKLLQATVYTGQPLAEHLQARASKLKQAIDVPVNRLGKQNAGMIQRHALREGVKQAKVSTKRRPG